MLFLHCQLYRWSDWVHMIQSSSNVFLMRQISLIEDGTQNQQYFDESYMKEFLEVMSGQILKIVKTTTRTKIFNKLKKTKTSRMRRLVNKCKDTDIKMQISRVNFCTKLALFLVWRSDDFHIYIYIYITVSLLSLSLSLSLYLTHTHTHSLSLCLAHWTSLSLNFYFFQFSVY